MDGIKPMDFTAASPIARVSGPAGPGKSNGPGPIMAAPDPITVVEKPVAQARSPIERVSQLEIRGLVKEMAARPPVDTSRIQALKARIESGTFTIDPGRVADAMLGSLRSRAA